MNPATFQVKRLDGRDRILTLLEAEPMADLPLIHPNLSYEDVGMPCHAVKPNRHQPQQFNNYGQKAKSDYRSSMAYTTA